MLPLQARCALEWMTASGARNSTRLFDLVNHYCTLDGINDSETRLAIFQQALKVAERLPGFVNNHTDEITPQPRVGGVWF